MPNKKPEVGDRIITPTLDCWAKVTRIINTRTPQALFVAVVRDMDPGRRTDIIIDWNVCLMHNDVDPFTGIKVKDPLRRFEE